MPPTLEAVAARRASHGRRSRGWSTGRPQVSPDVALEAVNAAIERAALPPNRAARSLATPARPWRSRSWCPRTRPASSATPSSPSVVVRASPRASSTADYVLNLPLARPLTPPTRPPATCSAATSTARSSSRITRRRLSSPPGRGRVPRRVRRPPRRPRRETTTTSTSTTPRRPRRARRTSIDARPAASRTITGPPEHAGGGRPHRRLGPRRPRAPQVSPTDSVDTATSPRQRRGSARCAALLGRAPTSTPSSWRATSWRRRDRCGAHRGRACRVPEDVAIVGFDDSRRSRHPLSPSSSRRCTSRHASRGSAWRACCSNCSPARTAARHDPADRAHHPRQRLIQQAPR